MEMLLNVFFIYLNKVTFLFINKIAISGSFHGGSDVAYRKYGGLLECL